MSDQNQLCIDSYPRPDRPHCSIIKEQDDCRIGNESGRPMILGRAVVVAATETSGCRVGFLAAGSSLANAERRTYAHQCFISLYKVNYTQHKIMFTLIFAFYSMEN